MPYTHTHTRTQSDISRRPLGIQDLQFHRLGPSSRPIIFLLDRNGSSRCVWEMESERRALFVDVRVSEGCRCRQVNCSSWRFYSSRWDTLRLRALCRHFHRLVQTLSSLDELDWGVGKRWKQRWEQKRSNFKSKTNSQKLLTALPSRHKVQEALSGSEHYHQRKTWCWNKATSAESNLLPSTYFNFSVLFVFPVWAATSWYFLLC